MINVSLSLSLTLTLSHTHTFAEFGGAEAMDVDAGAAMDTTEGAKVRVQIWALDFSVTVYHILMRRIFSLLPPFCISCLSPHILRIVFLPIFCGVLHPVFHVVLLPCRTRRTMT